MLQTFFYYFVENFLKQPDRKKLPQSVKLTIIARERANEILARIIQILIVVLFLTIYTVSPKTSPEEAFYPVPWVLGSYLILSLIGFFWSLKARLPDWSVYFSILFDFAMLYGLMISFHFQYMQPASFILKAPALLYVFIFIALRVLRLEAKFVLMAGGAAAAGWLSMIIYVVQADPENSMLTRSYVEYLTSNSVLIGAEVDKILSIGFVTIILALAVNGSANLLTTAVTEKQAAKALSRFFDQSISENIRSDDAMLTPGRGEHINAAILNVDIRQFTKLASQLDASQVMYVLSCYQNRIGSIIQSHGGVIDKFMGDGIMATFGLANATADKPGHCAQQAMEAVEAIANDLEKWPVISEELAMIHNNGIGMGLAGGQVAFGAVGLQDRLEMTVIGSAVNLSAKLEKHNKIMGTLIAVSSNVFEQATREGFKPRLEYQKSGQAIIGVSEQQNIYAVKFVKKSDKQMVSSRSGYAT